MWSIPEERRQIEEFKTNAEHFHKILEDTEPNLFDQLAAKTEEKIELLKKAENIPVIVSQIKDAFLKTKAPRP